MTIKMTNVLRLPFENFLEYKLQFFSMILVEYILL